MEIDLNEIYVILSQAPEVRSEADIGKLALLTKNINLFKQITIEQESNEVHSMCCQVLSLKLCKENEIIAKFGDKGENFYVILTGHVSVRVPTKKKITVDRQSFLHIKDHITSSKASDAEGEKLMEKIIINIVDVLNSARIPSAILQEEEDFKTCILNEEEKKLLKLFTKSMNKEQKVLLSMFKYTEMNNVEIEIQDFKEEAVLGPGDSFGELSVISERLNAATYKAKEKCSFMILNKVKFTVILSNLAQRRVNLITSFLEKMQYFNFWSKMKLIKFSYLLQPKNLQRNQFLYREGDSTDGIYFIRNGEITICKKHTLQISEIPKAFIQASKFSSKYLKKKHNFINIKIIIKGKHESVGAFEILNYSDTREFSCYCSSTESELYFMPKNIFYSRINDLDTMMSIFVEENIRISNRYSSLTDPDTLNVNYYASRSPSPVSLDKHNESVARMLNSYKSNKLIISNSMIPVNRSTSNITIDKTSEIEPKPFNSHYSSKLMINRAPKMLNSSFKIRKFSPMSNNPTLTHLYNEVNKQIREKTPIKVKTSLATVSLSPLRASKVDN